MPGQNDESTQAASVAETSLSQIGVFAKYWEPGTVKTRLAQDIGNELAADLYRQFILSTLNRVSGIASRQTLVITPPERAKHFLEVALDDWTIESQLDGDLGARITGYFQLAFDHHFKRVVLIGSDSPTVPHQFIEEAFDRLHSFDCVIGPANDGGYYLIGLSGFHSAHTELFESIQWSTQHVFNQTMKKAEQLKLSVHTLATWYDVDTIEDLTRVVSDLNRQPHETLTEAEKEICLLAADYNTQ